MNNLEKIREYWNTRSEGYRQQIEKEREEHMDEFYKEYFRQIPEVESAGYRVLSGFLFTSFSLSRHECDRR